MIKKKYIGGLILISFVFFTLLSLAPVSPCVAPPHYEDEHTKIYKYNSKHYNVSWETYNFPYEKTENKIWHILIYYTEISKNPKIVEGNGHITLEKINNNKIKISESYSTYDKSLITYKKTNLTLNKFYWEIYKPKMLKTIKHPMTVTTYCIDQGKTKPKSISYNNTPDIFKYDPYFNYSYGTSNLLEWNTYSYSGSSKLAIELHYSASYNYSSSNFHGSIKIKQFNKNQLKIVSKDLIKVNGDKINNQIQYVDTTLSPQQFYKKIYRTKMIDNYLNYKLL